MKNTVVKMAVLMILVMVNLVWGQELYNELFPPKEKMSKAQIEQQFKEYTAKWNKLDLKSKSSFVKKSKRDLSKYLEKRVNAFYYNRINLNAYEELKTIGVNLEDYVVPPVYSSGFTEAITFSSVVIVGTITNSWRDFNSPPICEIRIDEFLKGSYLYNPIPQIIYIEQNLEVSGKYIFVLGQNQWTIKDAPKRCKNPNLWFGFVPDDFCSKILNNKDGVARYNGYKKKVLDFERINDTKNFYQKRFK